uniref:Nitroreductase n=1 Tax=Taiwanofungus camphoratus TaxID=2696576 RepID=K4EGT7_TAICA|nr:nitroreductase [Taiwanofungus camphoratus]
MSSVQYLRNATALVCRTQRTTASASLAARLRPAPLPARTLAHIHKRTMASAQFFEAIKKRRTYYVLTNASPVPDARIEGIVKDAVLHVPSSFNSQTSRVVVLLRTDHARLWDITAESLKPVAPAAQWPTTVKKLESFKAAYGTILYFEDEDAVRGLQKQFPLYQDSFPIWAEHTNGMIQFAIWTAFELEGLGASLQHYNPLIDQKVKAEWNIPATWKLIAEMPFGTPGAPAGDKQFNPIDDRVKVYGK